MTQATRLLFALFLVSLPLGSCGGGGGGGGNEGNPARAFIDTRPTTIDTGDITSVRIQLFDVAVERTPAILVKVQHPSGLSYVGPALLNTPAGEVDTPLFPVTSNSDETAYVVFSITSASFRGNDNSGTIDFGFVGTGRIDNGTISVDVDQTDAINFDDYDPDNPQFTAIDSASIRVVN